MTHIQSTHTHVVGRTDEARLEKMSEAWSHIKLLYQSAKAVCSFITRHFVGFLGVAHIHYKNEIQTNCETSICHMIYLAMLLCENLTPCHMVA